VRFFDGPAEAERAGYRACLRCRPSDAAPASEEVELVAMCRALEGAEPDERVERTLERAGFEPTRARRLFRKIIDISPGEYVRALRGRRLRGALRDEAASVTQTLYRAGYGSSAAFYEDAPSQLGMRPSTYRRGGVGEVVRFAVGESSLGSFVVAATDVGVCALLLGDDPDELLLDLQERFDGATFVGADADFEATVAAVVGLLDDREPSPALPLDVCGTAFQRRVWDALSRIPRGKVATYAEIAARIGRPRSVRAVANACARSPVALLVPCHRVVRTDGGLGGYRWGIERKEALLQREGERR
jgi:AraC family transcriptional regulator of adaptative response/methylated-DNA-[protein]-cysteine methyltransferase